MKYLSWEINSLLEGILVTWDGGAAPATAASSSRDAAAVMWKLEKGAQQRRGCLRRVRSSEWKLSGGRWKLSNSEAGEKTVTGDNKE